MIGNQKRPIATAPVTSNAPIMHPCMCLMSPWQPSGSSAQRAMTEPAVVMTKRPAAKAASAFLFIFRYVLPMLDRPAYQNRSIAFPRLLNFPTLLLAILTSSLTTANAGEDRRFEEQRLQLAESVVSALVKGKICESPSECRKRNLFFVSPATHGLAVEIRTVSDPSVVQNLLGEAARSYVTSRGSMRVIVNFYADDKLVAIKRPMFSTEKPTFSAVYGEVQ